MSVRTTAACVAVALGGLAGAAHADAVLIASHVVMPDGTLKADMGVLISDAGVIERVEPAANLADHPRAVVLPPGAVLSPGLIELGSSVGVFRANAGVKGVVDPDASVIDAFDVTAPDVHAALAAGVTSVMLAPAFNGLVDGTCATVRLFAKDGAADVLNAECALAFGMGDAAFDQNLGPTARGGALQMMRSVLGAAADDTTTRLGRVVDGTLPAVVRFERSEDVSSMLRLLGRYDVVPTLVNAAFPAELAEEVADYDAAAVVGPYGFNSAPAVLAAPAALHKAGVRFGFSGGLPSREAGRLRLTAALAVRYGLDAAAARRALTADAAKLAGVSNRVGAVAPGRAADLVVFSGDPLRLESRVLDVWVQGRHAYRATRHHSGLANRSGAPQ